MLLYEATVFCAETIPQKFHQSLLARLDNLVAVDFSSYLARMNRIAQTFFDVRFFDRIDAWMLIR